MIGCPSIYEGFVTLEEAQAYMSQNKVTEPREVIKEGAGETRPLCKRDTFYAVAYGKRPGIYTDWEYEP